MDFSQIGILVIAGTIGAWFGMRLSRYLKRSRTKQNGEKKNPDREN